MADNGTVAIQMHKILQEVDKAAKDALEKSIAKVSRETVNKLKNTSPQRPGGGSYARGWAVKKVGKDGVIVHNRTDYQLTHLLEKSHVIRNQYGTYGRTTPKPHIKPAEDWANEELVNEIMRELNV